MYTKATIESYKGHPSSKCISVQASLYRGDKRDLSIFVRYYSPSNSFSNIETMKNPDLNDIFFRRTGERKFGNLTDEEMQEVAVRLMNKIRLLSEQEWDESAIDEIRRFDSSVITKGGVPSSVREENIKEVAKQFPTLTFDHI